VDTSVGRLEDAAGGRAHVVDIWIARHPGDRGNTVAFGSDVAKFELAVCLGIDLGPLGPGKTGDADQHCCCHQQDETGSLQCSGPLSEDWVIETRV
jgi:hypothetical protein